MGPMAMTTGLMAVSATFKNNKTGILAMWACRVIVCNNRGAKREQDY